MMLKFSALLRSDPLLFAQQNAIDFQSILCVFSYIIDIVVKAFVCFEDELN